jgi:hypothetical protein
MRTHAETGTVVINLCEKYIIISEHAGPCNFRFGAQADAPGRWVKKTYAFDSGTLGAEVPAYWPVTLMIGSSYVPPVELTDIELSDGRTNVVANGDFAQGMDRWILISDFEHLAWHIKDLYLEIFFETGAVGLILYLFALGLAFIRAFVLARRQDLIGLAAIGALAGFSVVGLVGSLLDNPRPALMFFIIFFWILGAEPRATAGPRPS